MSAPQKRTNIDLPTTFKVNDFLKDILVQETDGYWKYTANWTDGAVAEELAARLGVPITAGNVKGVRNAMFGPLRVWGRDRKESPPAVPQEDIEQFRREISKVYGSIGAMTARIQNAESKVAADTKRVDDVVHNFEARLVELEKNLIFARHLSATRIAGRVEELEAQVREHKIELGKMKLKTKFG